MLVNMFADLMQKQINCHEGEQYVDAYRAFDRRSHLKTLDFIDFVRVPPGATIGRHQHGDNCEWYVITEGQGRMWFMGEERTVKPGDVLMNPANGEHGLVNDTEGDVHLVVIQFSGEDHNGY